MRRRKRQIAGWIALGLAIALTVPGTAQAKPQPVVQPMELGLSEGKIKALGLLEQGGMKSLDDRSFPQARGFYSRQPMELGLSEGKIRALGLLEQSGTTPAASGSDRSIDVNAYTVTGFGASMLFAIAIGIGLVAVWHRRGTKLSPA